MYVMSNLGEVEALCNRIMNSPYFIKKTPAELEQLRDMLDKVNLLVKESVPQLVAEVKQLRNQNKRLLAEIEALNASGGSPSTKVAGNV